MHVVTEGHWQNLLRAMGREDLKDDPRFRTNAARTAEHGGDRGAGHRLDHRPRQRRRSSRRRNATIPCAPVRNAVEVMNDPHMHERGMLQRIEHPSLGPIVIPNSPLRLHGAGPGEAGAEPALGQHNLEVYDGWLGLPEAEVAALQRDGVI